MDEKRGEARGTSGSAITKQPVSDRGCCNLQPEAISLCRRGKSGQGKKQVKKEVVAEKNVDRRSKGRIDATMKITYIEATKFDEISSS